MNYSWGLFFSAYFFRFAYWYRTENLSDYESGPLTDKCYANNMYVVGIVSYDTYISSTHWTNFYSFHSRKNTNPGFFPISMVLSFPQTEQEIKIRNDSFCTNIKLHKKTPVKCNVDLCFHIFKINAYSFQPRTEKFLTNGALFTTENENRAKYVIYGFNLWYCQVLNTI